MGLCKPVLPTNPEILIFAKNWPKFAWLRNEKILKYGNTTNGMCKMSQKVKKSFSDFDFERQQIQN